jgi:16S rRNA processing protein RimM
LTQPSPDLDPSSAVSVGRIVAPHGLKGEIKVEPLTDFPERFQRGARLWLKGEPRRVQMSRPQGKLVYLKLAGINSRESVNALRGEELLVPEAFPIEAADVYYQHDILGLRVEDEAGELLGNVAQIIPTGSNDVYVVRGERGELLLPALEDVIKLVDLPNGRLVVEILPGLEFTKIPTPTPKAPKRPARRKRPPTPPPADDTPASDTQAPVADPPVPADQASTEEPPSPAPSTDEPPTP